MKLAERGFYIGHRLRELRRAQALTQEELAEEADVHAVTISDLEREPDTRRASARTVRRLAKALGVSVPELTDTGGRPRFPGGARTEQDFEEGLDFEEQLRREREDKQGENGASTKDTEP